MISGVGCLLDNAFLFALVFVLSVILNRWFIQPRSLIYVLDHPNGRSLHDTPIPRTGGWAFLLAWFLGIAFSDLTLSAFYALLFGAGILAAVGVLDDLKGLRALTRFIFQVFVAAVLIYASFTFRHIQLPGMDLYLPAWLAILVTVLAIVWMTNLYNFMDGMDGLAAVMAILGFSTYAWWGYQAGDGQFLVINLMIVSSVLGFFVWNFPPAKIFMGDAGSLTLGFLSIAIALLGIKKQLFGLLEFILVFSPFIIDATYTLMRRAIRGEKIWQAHREHLYQRLVGLGWNHKQTLGLYACLMLGSSVSALVLHRLSIIGQWSLLVFWSLLYASLILMVAFLERKNRELSGNNDKTAA